MKIGFLNDLHLPEIRNTAQYHYFQKALEDIRREKPELVIVNGDIIADGG